MSPALERKLSYFNWEVTKKHRKKSIKQSRFYDVRIESILLDVNKKENYRVFVVIITLKRPRI